MSPLEVEEVLLLHPAVTDAACFGVPDEKYGEEVAAAVALRDASTERELIEHCRARLIDFKVPKVVYILEAIPRTPTGSSSADGWRALSSTPRHEVRGPWRRRDRCLRRCGDARAAATT